MSPAKWRLVATLSLVRVYLGPVITEILFDELSPEDRRDLAQSLRIVADQLDRARPGDRTQPNAEQLRPAGPASAPWAGWPERSRFSANGP